MIEDRVKGTAKILGVIGNPIEHTFSPIIHNTIAKLLNHDIVYVPFHVKEDNLENAVKGAYALGIQGLNVTIPHKLPIINYLVDLEPRTKIINSVNTLKIAENGYIGYNTDIIGIIKTFKHNNVTLDGKVVVIIGAGGSSYAASVAAASQNAAAIYIVNRSLENSQKLANFTKIHYNININSLSFDELDKISDIDVLMQTSSVGFGSLKHLSPIYDKTFLSKAKVALDVIYTPWETEFLKLMKECGVTCFNGFDMLIYQAIASYEIWLGYEFSEDLTLKLKEELRNYYLKGIK